MIKNELAGGVMPCGRFGAQCDTAAGGVLTYFLLTALKRLALPPELPTARPKRLRFIARGLRVEISRETVRLQHVHAGKPEDYL